jgi:large subunit ribosomal protein L13
MLAEKPENLIRIAVAGMLPKNNLGRRMLKKLKVYSGNVHPHEAQCPHALSV